MRKKKETKETNKLLKEGVIEMSVEEYNKEVDRHNAEIDKYNAEEVDKYNEEVEKYNKRKK